MCGLIIARSYEDCAAGLKKMSHRGYNQEIVQANPFTWIGHVRLPINGIDVPPPYADKDNNLYWMVGEYYNYDREKYPCDLDALAEWMLENPDRRPHGMYHVVKVEDESFTITQDLWNKKPLYYRRDVQAYASEIKALTCLGPVTIDRVAMIEYKHRGYSEHTPYNEIRKVTAPRIVVTEDWHDHQECEIKSDYPAMELVTALRVAVNNRALADVPVGVLLSGGLDSSIIYTMLRQLGHNPHVFHVYNDEEEYLKYLDIPEDKLHFVTPRAFKELNDLKEILYYNETPQDLGSMIPQYEMGKAIKELGLNIPVIITGDGADELFGGYKRCVPGDDLRYEDLYYELRDYHLPRLDKLMMAHTLELRSPFLDEGVTQIADNIEWDDIVGKKPLKEIAKQIGVHQAIIDRKKVPLKSETVKLDKIKWRKHLINAFKHIFGEGLELEL